MSKFTYIQILRCECGEVTVSQKWVYSCYKCGTANPNEVSDFIPLGSDDTFILIEGQTTILIEEE